MEHEKNRPATAPITVFNEDVEETNDTHQPQTTIKHDENSDHAVPIAAGESFDDDVPIKKTFEKPQIVPPTRDDSLTTISEDSIADGSMSKYDSLDRTPKVSTVSGYGTTSKRRISKVESIV